MYDIIGDIHGYASALKRLLEKLDYRKSDGAYRHPDRKVLFLGDYIDRGPEVRETLRLVRQMVDAGQAIALMGNHELNAIFYNEPDGRGGYLRPHSEKNRKQHRETLKDFEGNRDDYQSYISWFKTLPLFHETESFRAIHACWDSSMIDELQNHVEGNMLPDEDFREAGDRNTRLYDLLETLLKGREVTLPEGLSFRDKDGHRRDEVRVRWWLDPQKVTLEDWSFAEEMEGSTNGNFDPADYQDGYYTEDEKPVFFGHYWLSGKPELERSNVCCLDYSIGKGEKLAAYRHEGEEELVESKLNWVEWQGR
ncbi:phosphoesterase [Balneolaceae bacterium YR4-1]|uniref:Phosphoesterase n=1 Tax=Halalkalibaculum roseum TaxID=2709311 RepID=A0A6M1SSE0_9BACT|nr:metallophosphoesterase [Halalkalibaculum roseum]NGP77989.1 phosphoesterase [Halalkalibaculum roseum]